MQKLRVVSMFPVLVNTDLNVVMRVSTNKRKWFA